ncbi:hypothetical protein FMEAI12_4640010 [Parafrankia sp. Ea1.12]|nr:hypothetical protein FMEAI12_4640010 [Parafrankia sp. Ea1.12]
MISCLATHPRPIKRETIHSKRERCSSVDLRSATGDTRGFRTRLEPARDHHPPTVISQSGSPACQADPDVNQSKRDVHRRHTAGDEADRESPRPT